MVQSIGDKNHHVYLGLILLSFQNVPIISCVMLADVLKAWRLVVNQAECSGLLKRYPLAYFEEKYNKVTHMRHGDLVDAAVGRLCTTGKLRCFDTVWGQSEKLCTHYE